MARVQMSVLSEALSGHAGNVVFVDSKYGTLARPRVKPTDPKSPAQMSMRSVFAEAARAYRKLDAQTHAKWQSYAGSQVKIQPTTGEAYHPRAIALFTALAGKRIQAGASLPASFAPPAGPWVPPNGAVSVTAIPGAIRLASEPEPIPSNARLELLLQPLPHELRKPVIPKMRTRAFLDLTLSPTVDVPVEPGVYGVAVRWIDLETGQSAPLEVLKNLSVPG